MSTDNIPPPAEGWILYGQGPLRVLAEREQLDDVGYYNPIADRWFYGSGIVGAIPYYYALRAGSEIARLNGLEEQPPLTINEDLDRLEQVAENLTQEEYLEIYQKSFPLPSRIQINGAWYRREDA